MPLWDKACLRTGARSAASLGMLATIARLPFRGAGAARLPSPPISFIRVVGRRREGSSVYYKVVDPNFVDICRTVSITVASIEKERPDALLPTMGGQTALNCALDLDREGSVMTGHFIWNCRFVMQASHSDCQYTEKSCAGTDSRLADDS